MVKAYLRYELSTTFGVVTSNSALVHDNSGKFVITAALENVAVWNIRQGTLVSQINVSIMRVTLPDQDAVIILRYYFTNF